MRLLILVRELKIFYIILIQFMNERGRKCLFVFATRNSLILTNLLMYFFLVCFSRYVSFITLYENLDIF